MLHGSVVTTAGASVGSRPKQELGRELPPAVFSVERGYDPLGCDPYAVAEARAMLEKAYA